MSCALVPFAHFQDLDLARDFLSPHRRQGSAAAGKESGECGARGPPGGGVSVRPRQPRDGAALVAAAATSSAAKSGFAGAQLFADVAPYPVLWR